MAVAGFCRTCGQYVWLNEQWGCVNGHAWDQIGNWYDPETSEPITPYWLQPAPSAAPEPEPVAAPVAAPAPAPPSAGMREAFLADLLSTFAAYPGYSVAYGTDTDVTIDNKVAEASWGTGKKKIEYEAVLKAVEAERVVYFWEILKEKGGGLNFGGMQSESYSTVGMKRFGKKKEVVVGPGGVAMDAEWDYAATRRIVEDVASRHGFKVKVVLRKGSAQYK